jgi:hypothetical protein
MTTHRRRAINSNESQNTSTALMESESGEPYELVRKSGMFRLCQIFPELYLIEW